MKLRPVDFATEGIYLAGLAHGPKFVDESIAQALAAVSRATTVLSKTTLEAEGIVASIGRGPLRRLRHLCPDMRIQGPEVVPNKKDATKKMVEGQRRPRKGCGACVGACPARGF